MTRSDFLKAATATLKAALILVNPGLNERLKAVKDWAGVIFPHQPEYDISERDLQRQIASVIDRSANFLESMSNRPEYQSVAEEDLHAALALATDTLQASTRY